jgi:hypothetical protein
MQLYARDRLVRDLGGEKRAGNDFCELAELAKPVILHEGVDEQEASAAELAIYSKKAFSICQPGESLKPRDKCTPMLCACFSAGLMFQQRLMRYTHVLVARKSVSCFIVRTLQLCWFGLQCQPGNSPSGF